MSELSELHTADLHAPLTTPEGDQEPELDAPGALPETDLPSADPSIATPDPELAPASPEPAPSEPAPDADTLAVEAPSVTTPEGDLDPELDLPNPDESGVLPETDLPSSEPESEPESAPAAETPAAEPEPPVSEPSPEPAPAPAAPIKTPGGDLEPAVAPAAVPAARVSAPPAPNPDPAEPEESFADIFSEFERSSSRREAADSRQIRGTVVNVTAESVFVDIGFKSEGILPLTAFPANREPIKPGETLVVSVKGRDLDGFYELSLFRTARPRDWSGLERAFEEKSTVVGTVTAVVKGGLHVDVGVRAFLPASRSGARDAAEMEKLVGQEIRCRITKLDVADEDVVVDRRVVTEEEALEAKGRRFAEVTEGAIVDGVVRSITEYGAFVDLGGVDGLLHISDIAWTRVAKVADVLTVGQQLEVKVLRIDPETRRIALGLKQLQPEPWQAVPDKYHPGDRVRGVVTRTTDFGAFVEIEPGVEGLIHLSEMSWSKRINRATEVMKAGDVVEAAILSISLPERRISLSLKQALGDPWVESASKLAPGSIVEGPVSSITKFGAFVSVAEGVEGLVHISEIVADRRLNHPSDVLRVGQVVQAQIIEIDREKRQLRLSMKQLIPTGLDEFLKEHKAGDIVTGRVVAVTDIIAQVELGEGVIFPAKLPTPVPVEAPVPAPAASTPAVPAKVDLSAFSSMLKTKWKTGGPSSSSSPTSGKSSSASGGTEDVKPGQVRSFRITALDPGAKSISLELA